MSVTHQKNVKFVIIGTFKDIGFRYEKYFCNGCHGLMQKAVSFNDVAIMLKGVLRELSEDMSEDDAINIMNSYYLINNQKINK